MTTYAARHRPPSPADMRAAKGSAQALERYATRLQGARLQLAENQDEAILELPPSAVTILHQALLALAAGRRVALIQETPELTTTQAAEILNVSRPFIIGLLEKGAIPYRRVGRHRRILAVDVMAYKADTVREREAALAALVQDAQAEGDGYP
jgi:excisionase family DNA binding protein